MTLPSTPTTSRSGVICAAKLVNRRCVAQTGYAQAAGDGITYTHVCAGNTPAKCELKPELASRCIWARNLISEGSPLSLTLACATQMRAQSRAPIQLGCVGGRLRGRPLDGKRDRPGQPVQGYRARSLDGGVPERLMSGSVPVRGIA